MDALLFRFDFEPPFSSPLDILLTTISISWSPFSPLIATFSEHDISFSSHFVLSLHTNAHFVSSKTESSLEFSLSPIGIFIWFRRINILVRKHRNSGHYWTFLNTTDAYIFPVQFIFKLPVPRCYSYWNTTHVRSHDFSTTTQWTNSIISVLQTQTFLYYVKCPLFTKLSITNLLIVRITYRKCPC